jgi:hypothetical protein
LQRARQILGQELGLSDPDARDLMIASTLVALKCAREINQRTHEIARSDVHGNLRNAFVCL